MEEIVTCQGCAQHGPAESCPGESPARRGIDRRELLVKGGLAAAAALLAACAGSLGTDATGSTFSGSFTIKVSDYPALAQSGGVAVVNAPGGYPIAVENTGSGYIALGLICPHRGGYIQTFSNGFQCPVHGATFNKSGTWIGGQPTSNMTRFTVTADASGNLTIG